MPPLSLKLLKNRLILALAASLFSAGNAAAESLEFVDDLGRQVQLAQPAQRIVSLAPSITELLFHLNLGDRLIGVDQSSDWPEQAKTITNVGDAFRTDLERLKALKPDLIFTWASGYSVDKLNRVANGGFAVYALEPDSIADIGAIMRRIGQVAGIAKFANQQAAAFENSLAQISLPEYPEKQANRLPVFIQIWHKPLITLSGNHMLSDALNRCGGSNIFPEPVANKAPHVGLETVIARQPKMILLPGTADDLPAALEFWQPWQSVPAVRDQNFVLIEGDVLLRWGPRVLQGLKQLCSEIAWQDDY